jgi:hypothetical protein
MKKHFPFIMLLLASSAFAQGLQTQPDSTQSQAPLPTATASFAPVEQGQDYTRWEQIVLRTNALGRVSAQTNSYTELETSARFLNNGQWQPSQEEIQLAEVGAVANTSPHKIAFAGNINSSVSVQVTTPDGTALNLRPLGLAYFDFQMTNQPNQVMFADLQDSVGILVGSNQVFYTNALSGCEADVCYTYKKSGIEQDIILRQAPPSPETYGLNPTTTWLLVFTEVINAPTNVAIVRQIRRGWTKSTVDKIIQIGSMSIGPGTAYGLGLDGDRNTGVPVQKHWEVVNGRTFLVEEVTYRLIQSSLSGLQASLQSPPGSGRGPARRLASKSLALPAVPAAGSAQGWTMRVAAVRPKQKGVVVDFDLESGTGMVLQSGQTYHVAGTVNLTNTVIQGGSVVKYSRGASINLLGTVTCTTGPYYPCICTAVDDNTVGATIYGSSGSPTGLYAANALSLGLGGDLSYLNIRYASNAVYCGNSDYYVRDAQILNCNVGFHSESANFVHGNILMSHVLTNFYGHLFNGTVAQLTTDQAQYLFDDWDFYVDGECEDVPSSSLQLLNSITCSVTNYAPEDQSFAISADCVANLSSGAGVFQSVGAGNYYLANDTYRYAGTLGIESSLLDELAEKTTYAPLLCSNYTTAADTALSAYAQRDTHVPDLGFHYDVIDWLACSFVVTNATLTITNGTTIGYYDDPGIWLQGGAAIVCEGTATAPNRFVNYRTVQEMPVQIGSGSQMPVSNNRMTGAAASAIYRFTDFYRMPGNSSPYDLYASGTGWNYSTLEVDNCQFFGSDVQISDTAFAATNNLFASPYITVSVVTGDYPLAAYNNLFLGTAVELDAGPAYPWLIRNNSFDSGSFMDSFGDEATVHEHNAFINSSQDVFSTDPSDLVLTNFVYVSGPLGDYYQASTNLVNEGSIRADYMGLYWYTTRTNQLMETNTMVDIGFHYVALDATGNPVDISGDGVPDYLADVNGDGVVDGSEVDWQTYNSVNGLTFSAGLQVYTPLH